MALKARLELKVSFIKFWLKFITLLIFLVILDFFVGNLLEIFYFKQKFGAQFRTTYSIEKTTEQVLIFGSSTAAHNYNPEIFQKKLRKSVYNCGIDGSSIFYDYAILKGVIKRYQPHIIILNIDQDEFVKKEESYDQLASLLPYYSRDSELRSIVNMRSRYEKLKLLSHVYQYNSSIFSIVAGNLTMFKDRDENIKGFVPLNKMWEFPIEDGSVFENHEFDTNKIQIFNYFINDCIKNKINLYLACSPFYLKSNYNSYSVELAEKIAREYNIKFFSFAKDSVFLNHPEFFADKSHLNINGATLYSNIVCDSISKSDSMIQNIGIRPE
jgi:hypothetical protein